jgi:hypothetical protein
MESCVSINEMISFTKGDEKIKKQKLIKIGNEVIYLPDDAISALKGSVTHKKPFREIIKETRSEWA